VIFAATFSLPGTASLVVSLIAAGLFTYGWRLAVHKDIKTHRWVQTAAASLNAVLAFAWMIWTFALWVAPELPARLGQESYAITTVHAAVGSIGLLLGLYVVLSANGVLPKSLRFSNYKLFMRTSYALYMVATLVGVAVYVVVHTG
jgi:uncharacterized membrane protein YozB (DUF420 family)